MKLKGREKINELLIYLKKSNDYKDKNELMEYIKNNELPFDDDTFYDVIKIIIDNNYSFAYSLELSIELYDIIDEYNIYLKVLSTFLKNNIKLNSNKLLYSTIYNLFENKKLFLQINEKLVNENYLDTYKLKKIHDFMIEVRKYYVDEIAFFSSVIEVMDKYIVSDSFIEDKIEEAKKIAGLYEFDEDYLKNLPKKIHEIEREYSNLDKDCSKLSEKIVGSLVSIDNKYISLDDKYNLLQELNNELNNMNDKIKDVLNYENVLITQEDIEEEANKIFNEIKQYFVTNYQLEDKEDEIDLTIIKLIKREMRVNKTLTISKEKFKYDYWARKNNTQYILDELYNKKLIKEYSDDDIYKFLSYKYASLFDKETYIKAIRNIDHKLNFILFNDPLFLRDILKINPYFNFHLGEKYGSWIVSSFDERRLQEIKRVFKADMVAHANESLKYLMLNCYIEQFEYCKKIFEINPDFSHFVTIINKMEHKTMHIDNLLYPNNILSPEKTANLSKYSKAFLHETCVDIYGNICHINEMDSLTEYEIKYINDFIDELNIRRKNLYNNPVYICNITKLMNMGISINEYLDLSYDDEKELVSVKLVSVKGKIKK